MKSCKEVSWWFPNRTLSWETLVITEGYTVYCSYRKHVYASDHQVGTNDFYVLRDGGLVAKSSFTNEPISLSLCYFLLLLSVCGSAFIHFYVRNGKVTDVSSSLPLTKYPPVAIVGCHTPDAKYKPRSMLLFPLWQQDAAALRFGSQVVGARKQIRRWGGERKKVQGKTGGCRLA